MRTAQARTLVTQLARAATGGGPRTWSAGVQLLEEFDGRTWLLLDEAARSFVPGTGTPVSGTAGWTGAQVSEPSGFVAAVTSFHADGRIRQRAVRVLAEQARAQGAGPVAATALAVRLLDHVPAVRDEARDALSGCLKPQNATAVLSLLLAGGRRRHATPALAVVQEMLLERWPVAELAGTLVASSHRGVRRWALTLGRERGLLPPGQLLGIVRSDPDQWMRAAAAEGLLLVADPRHLSELLAAHTVEGRLVALARMPDEALRDDDLVPLLADRAPRVRAQARWRARGRGLDVAQWYREQIDGPERTGRFLAACLDGLATVGGRSDLGTFAGHLRHRDARVRVAAVVGVGTHAIKDEVVDRVGPVLLDPSARVSSAAVRALIRVQAPSTVAQSAWRSPQPASRRAAWRLSRSAGGWDRLEADLRAAADTDASLASLGRAGVRSWLQAGAATAWTPLGDEQRERIRVLLVTGGADDRTGREVAFHAGLRRPASGS